MRYYHRLALSVSRQLEDKSDKEKDIIINEFFQKFKENDY